MLPLRYKWLWLGMGLASMALILLLALAPLSRLDLPLPDLNDKVAHFVAFVFLTAWFLGLFRPGMSPWVMGALLGYGLLIEFLQGLTPFRAVEAADVVSDLAGIGTGWLLASAGLRNWCSRVEALLGAGPS